MKCPLVIKFWWRVKNWSIAGEPSSAEVTRHCKAMAPGIARVPCRTFLWQALLGSMTARAQTHGIEWCYQWYWKLSTSNGLPSAGKSRGNSKSFINRPIKANVRKSFPKWEKSILCCHSRTKPFLVWYQMTNVAAALPLEACTKQAEEQLLHMPHVILVPTGLESRFLF